MPPDPREFLVTTLRHSMSVPGTDDEILALRVEATGLDSLDLMELLNEIEEAFEIRVEDDTVSSATTVSELAEFIAHKAAGRRRERE